MKVKIEFELPDKAGVALQEDVSGMLGKIIARMASRGYSPDMFLIFNDGTRVGKVETWDDKGLRLSNGN